MIPSTVQPNSFVYKSLSSHSLNMVIGCHHRCSFCSVPETSTRKLVHKLTPFGVTDPDREWGQYAMVRPWDEKQFRVSLAKAEATPPELLPADSNRAIIVSSTTDPYQVIRGADPDMTRELNAALRESVRSALEIILAESTMNVRVLTRSPLSSHDFDLFARFGTRLMFGMSVPTLNDKLARVYEPGAPSVTQRIRTLREAKARGLNIYVAVAPTYPECDEADLRQTLSTVATLNPLTVFHEPINVRAKNADRIDAEALRVGAKVNTSALRDRVTWRGYAISQLKMVERLAAEVGLSSRLHLWPDASLGSKTAISEQQDQGEYRSWLDRWWSRKSEWPTN